MQAALVSEGLLQPPRCLSKPAKVLSKADVEIDVSHLGSVKT
jgi:hypothetical protein